MVSAARSQAQHLVIWATTMLPTFAANRVQVADWRNIGGAWQRSRRAGPQLCHNGPRYDGCYNCQERRHQVCDSIFAYRYSRDSVPVSKKLDCLWRAFVAIRRQSWAPPYLISTSFVAVQVLPQILTQPWGGARLPLRTWVAAGRRPKLERHLTPTGRRRHQVPHITIPAWWRWRPVSVPSKKLTWHAADSIFGFCACSKFPETLHDLSRPPRCSEVHRRPLPQRDKLDKDLTMTSKSAGDWVKASTVRLPL